MAISNLKIIPILLITFLLPIFFVPGTILPFGVGKVFLVFVLIIISLLALLVFAFRERRLVLPWHPISLVLVALPVVYLVSALTSSSPLTLYGYSFEVGTWLSIFLAALLSLIIPLVLETTSQSFKLLVTFFSGGILVVIFGLIKVFSKGKLFSLVVLTGVMGNPVGVWTDYALFVAALILLSLLGLEMLKFQGAIRWILVATLVLSAVLLGVINFALAWQLLLGFSLLTVLYLLTIGREGKRFPILSIVVSIVALVFVLNPTLPRATNDLRTSISNYYGVQNLNVRPSFSTTNVISGEALKGHSGLGTGPNTFAESWFSFKPLEVNESPFWNTAFSSGFSFLSSQLVGVGILGLAVWFLLIGLILWLTFKVFMHGRGSQDRFLPFASTLLVLFFWLSLVFMVPGPSIFFLAFLFLGFWLSVLVRFGVIRSREWTFAEVHKRFVTLLLALILVIAIATSLFASIKQTISLVWFDSAMALSSVPGTAVTKVEENLTKALAHKHQDIYDQALMNLEMARAQAIATDPKTKDATAFQTAIQSAITYAESARSLHPSYMNDVALGNIYAALVAPPLSVPGAYESALTVYQNAQKKNPLTPEIPLLIARMEHGRGKTKNARVAINQALALKADYAEAYFLLTQIEVAANDVPRAISAAKTAALLAPNDVGIYFELGLLEYSTQNFQVAAEALTRALKLVPEYANAKYFLGLSLDKLGYHNDALLQFEDLLKSNPDNKDLPVIIANIKAHRDALYQAPSGAHPEKKATPPISSGSR